MCFLYLFSVYFWRWLLLAHLMISQCSLCWLKGRVKFVLQNSALVDVKPVPWEGTAENKKPCTPHFWFTFDCLHTRCLLASVCILCRFFFIFFCGLSGFRIKIQLLCKHQRHTVVAPPPLSLSLSLSFSVSLSLSLSLSFSLSQFKIQLAGKLKGLEHKKYNWIYLHVQNRSRSFYKI